MLKSIVGYYWTFTKIDCNFLFIVSFLQNKYFGSRNDRIPYKRFIRRKHELL